MVAPDTAASPQALPARMPVSFRIFLALSAALFASSVVYLVLQVAMNASPHHGLPLDLYTRLPFYDLVGYVVKMPQVHQREFFTGEWPYVYPAPSIFIFKLFSLFAILPTRHAFFGSIVVYIVLVCSGLLWLRRRFALGLTRRGMLATDAQLFSWGTLLFSWPILYAVHQGNIEALLWMGLACAVWLYRQGRWMEFALVVGVFGSFKIYPLVFLILLVPSRRWRAIAGGLVVFATMTVAGMAYIGPSFTVALHRISAGIAVFNATGLSIAGLRLDSRPFDHSLNGLLHRTLGASPAALGLLIRWYMPVVGLAFLLLFFGRVRKLPAANQVLFVALSAVTLPSISFDYTLQLLYVPFAWIALNGVGGDGKGNRPRWLLPVIVCFALILSPELFLHVGRVLFYGQFKAVVLLVLFGLCLTYRLEDLSPEASCEAGAMPEAHTRFAV